MGDSDSGIGTGTRAKAKAKEGPESGAKPRTRAGRKAGAKDSEPQETRSLRVGDTMSSALSTVLASSFGGEFQKPFIREIFLRHMPVRGTMHVKNYRPLIKKLREGDPIVLRREPENEYDTWAILVLTETGKKLGYIPREENRILARLMDAGKNIYARVSRLNLEPGHWIPVWIAIYLED